MLPRVVLPDVCAKYAIPGVVMLDVVAISYGEV